MLDVVFFFAETHNTEKKKERKAQCQVQSSYYFMDKRQFNENIISD